VDGEVNDAALRAIAREQLTDMTSLIEYQLQRAATLGRTPLAAPVEIRPVAEKIVAALTKVFADKNVRVTFNIGTSATFHGDTGDLTEMLGNLLDNAFKWCRQHVQVAARKLAITGPGQSVLEITVADDGPGIPDDKKTRVLQRGARADENTPGHGLGLAMVQDTVALYHGTLSLQNSPLGGLAVCLQFPTRAA